MLFSTAILRIPLPRLLLKFLSSSMEEYSMNFIKKNGAGLLLCLFISFPAWFLGQRFPVVGGPVFSILIGMILTLFMPQKEDVYKRQIYIQHFHSFHHSNENNCQYRAAKTRNKKWNHETKNSAVASHQKRCNRIT